MPEKCITYVCWKDDDNIQVVCIMGLELARAWTDNELPSEQTNTDDSAAVFGQRMLRLINIYQQIRAKIPLPMLSSALQIFSAAVSAWDRRSRVQLTKGFPDRNS